MLNFVLGIVSALVIAGIFEVLRRRQLRLRYGRLAGDYQQLRSITLEANGQDTKITYLGGTALKTENKASEGKELPDSELWTGNIILSEGNPYYGEGVFRYTSKKNFGIHHIQVDHDKDEIYVTYETTEAGKEIFEPGSITWRRIK